MRDECNLHLSWAHRLLRISSFREMENQVIRVPSFVVADLMRALSIGFIRLSSE